MECQFTIGKTMKSVLATILLLTVFQLALATGLSEVSPYLRVTSNQDDSLVVYIGAFGHKAPRLNLQGNVEFYSLFVQVRASNGSPKGQMTENFVIANCDKQVYKSITLAYQDSEFEKPVIEIPDGTSAARDNDINYLLKKEKAIRVSPDTLASALIDAACNYVSKRDNKVTPKEKELEL